MYAVVDTDTIQFEILPPSDSGKALLCFRKNDQAKGIQSILYQPENEL